jgi:trans-2-enoyl-CoA reductase
MVVMLSTTKTSRTLIRRASSTLRRRYHELSFRSTGAPLDVLEYHQNDSDDQQLLGVPSAANNTLHHTSVGVDMLYAPLNPADVNTIQGRYPSVSKDVTRRQSIFHPNSTVAGSEGIGRIRHIKTGTKGSSHSFLKEGDIVTFGLPGLGTMRSFLWVPADSLIVIDRGEELLRHAGGLAAASTLPQLGGTALRMLSDFESSGTVIQNAGNSGVGFMASQLACMTMGRNVISMVRRGSRSEDEWQALVKHLTLEGKCFAVIAEEDLTTKNGMQAFQESLKLQNVKPPTLALNAVGGESASLLSKMLGLSGSMVTYGGMSKEPVTASTPHLIFKDLRYVGYWHSRWMTTHGYEEKKEMIDSLVDSVLDGGIAYPPVEEFALSKFSEALHTDGTQSGIRRKVVFRCQEVLL